MVVVVVVVDGVGERKKKVRGRELSGLCLESERIKWAGEREPEPKERARFCRCIMTSNHLDPECHPEPRTRVKR